MRSIGIALWVLGILLFAYAAFVFDPSVSSTYSSDRIVNLDRQQRQLLLGVAGLTLFLTGVILHALDLLFGPKETVTSAVNSEHSYPLQDARPGMALPPGVTQEEWDEELAAARAFNARQEDG
jgi:hypothetical protein